MKLCFSLVFYLVILTGCATATYRPGNVQASGLSEGARLLINTHILNAHEIANFDSKFTGQNDFELSWEKLNHWDDDISLDSSLEWHPVLYPYFFVENCHSVNCVQEKFIAMGRDFTEFYMQDARVKAQHHPFRPLKIIRSDWTVNQAMVEAIDQEPHNIKKKVGIYLRLRNFGQINQAQNLWGNQEPREQPDGFGSKVLDDIARAKMLIEVSKGHPDVLVFIGISQQRLKQQQSCFGGFFVKSGTVTSVPELNCANTLL